MVKQTERLAVLEAKNRKDDLPGKNDVIVFFAKILAASSIMSCCSGCTIDQAALDINPNPSFNWNASNAINIILRMLLAPGSF
jgi:hypothetical protein